MIAYVTGGKTLPREIADQIIDRTDGVPLFIEELTKTVVESGIVTNAGDSYAVAGQLPSSRSPHRSMLRFWRGLIGWRPLERWRRSALHLGVHSRMS
jgi:hypothetical protein